MPRRRSFGGSRRSDRRSMQKRSFEHPQVAMHPRASELISTLELQPHPEGGFYRELFRSSLVVAPVDGRGARTALTTIWFLLTAATWSRWHRVSSDEAWHL